MSIFALVVLVVLGLTTSSQGRENRVDPPREDVRVLTAIIEGILAQSSVTRSETNSSAIAVLRPESIPLCREPRPDHSPCAIPQQWRQFLEPNSTGGWPGLIPNERSRIELVASLESRNNEAKDLPPIELARLAIYDRNRALDPNDPYGNRALPLISLSLPGYSVDGHALVYGSYGCGSLCGWGKLFLLEKVDGQWIVKSSVFTFIS